ncbi:MAG: VWA domain-containing protein [Pyrinomonadaceae bacterium]
MALCLGITGSQAQEFEAIRVELPENGNLRVENLRGSVIVEVWGENYVSVSATTNGRQSRSPAIIQRTDRLLSVRVKAGLANEAGVSLTVRMPERTRAAIVTSTGTVKFSELPAALLVQTISGPIHADFPSEANVNITAESAAGAISSTLGVDGSAVAGRSTLKTRLGAGDRPVRLHSQSGRITLALASPTAARAPRVRRGARPDTYEEAEAKPPRLIGGNSESARAADAANASSSPEEVSEGDVIRVDTQLVSVNVSVIDRSTTRGLVGLKKQDFKLFEDGVEQNIAQFESSAAPFNLLLLIDLSGSTSNVIDLIKTAALHFVEAARPFDRIGVVTFAGTQVVVSPLTTDRAALRDRINAITQPVGSTKLYDSLAFAMEQGFKGGNGSGRNAVVLLSDGLDSTLPNVGGEGSTLPYNDLLRSAQEFDGVLYMIWTNTQVWEPTSPNDIQQKTWDLAADRLEDLGDAGGGDFYQVQKLKDLSGVYDQVVADLGTVYTLAYRPSNKLHDGKWRALRVTVNRPNAVARGKRGYYAK